MQFYFNVLSRTLAYLPGDAAADVKVLNERVTPLTGTGLPWNPEGGGYGERAGQAYECVLLLHTRSCNDRISLLSSMLDLGPQEVDHLF